jgi:DNA adenine methylase
MTNWKTHLTRRQSMRSFESVGQKDLFGEAISKTVVNVASVPQRSPFRYPGGKTWLVPRLRQWMRSLPWKPLIFIEPFAGGAISGLTVAFEELAEKVILVELDEDVAAVWKTILSEDNKWLADRIISFEPTIASVKSVVCAKPATTRERAFRTILKNRTFHGGILAPGSAPIKVGENGKGIKSRWYPETIARRIRDIETIANRIEFMQADGISVIREHASKKRAAYFIDPPYTAAGKRAGNRLYVHHRLDHELLFEMTSRVAGDFLMTYDNAPDLARMANLHGFETRTIAMKNTHHAVMDELLIGRDLAWVSA